jgi:tetratricopeptide (TPR) repeat protein
MRNRWLVLALVLFGLTTALGQQSGDEVSPEVQQLYAQARSAQQGGNATLAIEKYRAIIRVAPHIPAAYNNLGMLYFNESDYEHAAEILKRGLEINGKMPTASAMLGMCYFQLGKDDLALPLLKAAVRANAADEKAEMMLIHIQINLKIYNDAAAQLRAFLEKHPNSQEAWYLLGKTYLQLSEDALGRVHDIDPDSVIAHEISGEIDTSMHNYDLALVEFKKSCRSRPKPARYPHAPWRNLLVDRKMAVRG